jgi:hypothetical protein
MGWGNVELVQVAQHRDHSRAIVNAVMNLPFPKRQGTWLAEWLVAAQEKFCYMHVISYFYRSNDVGSVPNYMERMRNTLEPSDYYDARIYKVLHFIRGVGLIKG